MDIFGTRLSILRKKNKITQKKLGKALNYGYTAISNYESGRNEPCLIDLVKIADFFKVTTDYLLGRDLKSANLSNDTLQELNYINESCMQLSKEQKKMLYLLVKACKDNNSDKDNEDSKST